MMQKTTEYTMTSCEPRPGELWLAYVEFADHPGIGKVRPVFIVETNAEMCIALAAKVTSKDLREDASGNCIPIIDWNECGLLKPSYIRTDQRLELAYEKLLNEKPLGCLSESYLQLIIKAFSELAQAKSPEAADAGAVPSSPAEA